MNTEKNFLVDCHLSVLWLNKVCQETCWWSVTLHGEKCHIYSWRKRFKSKVSPHKRFPWIHWYHWTSYCSGSQVNISWEKKWQPKWNREKPFFQKISSFIGEEPEAKCLLSKALFGKPLVNNGFYVLFMLIMVPINSLFSENSDFPF